MKLRFVPLASVVVSLACVGAWASSPRHADTKAHDTHDTHAAPAAKAPPAAPADAHAPAPKPTAPAAHAVREPKAAPAKKSDGPSPAEVWTGLLEGNRRFVRGTPQTREIVRRRAELTAGQHPNVIVLGCSDSRVPPEILFDRTLGDIFVVRTAGHVVDRVAIGSIEYAVEHLHARLLVVLGHEKCGAVAAAASGQVPESPNLAAVVEQIGPSLAKLGDLVEGPALVSLGIEVNVHQAAKGLVEHSDVIREHVEGGKLGIVKALYRLESGEVVTLD